MYASSTAHSFLRRGTGCTSNLMGTSAYHPHRYFTGRPRRGGDLVLLDEASRPKFAFGFVHSTFAWGLALKAQTRRWSSLVICSSGRIRCASSTFACRVFHASRLALDRQLAGRRSRCTALSFTAHSISAASVRTPLTKLGMAMTRQRICRRRHTSCQPGLRPSMGLSIARCLRRHSCLRHCRHWLQPVRLYTCA